MKNGTVTLDNAIVSIDLNVATATMKAYRLHGVNLLETDPTAYDLGQAGRELVYAGRTIFAVCDQAVGLCEAVGRRQASAPCRESGVALPMGYAPAVPSGQSLTGARSVAGCGFTETDAEWGRCMGRACSTDERVGPT